MFVARVVDGGCRSRARREEVHRGMRRENTRALPATSLGSAPSRNAAEKRRLITRVCVRRAPTLRAHVVGARVFASVDARVCVYEGCIRGTCARARDGSARVCVRRCVVVGGIQLRRAGERIHRVGSYERRTSGGTRARDEG